MAVSRVVALRGPGEPGLLICLPALCLAYERRACLPGPRRGVAQKRRVAAAAINGHTTRRLPETLLGLVIPVVIILYMLKFSKSYPDRVTHRPAEAPVSH